MRRALRFWTVFSSPDVSGFYGLHEGERGERIELNDVFGTPFEGALHRGPDGPSIELVAAEHDVTLVPGTTRFQRATVKLTDADGGVWTQELEDVGTPWWPHTIGYGAGSWKDGGSMASYPGTDDVVVEWDDFDFSAQPFEHTTYDGRQVKGGAPHAEHLARTTTTHPRRHRQRRRRPGRVLPRPALPAVRPDHPMTTLTSHEDTSAWFSTRLRALEPDVEGVEVTAVQHATAGCRGRPGWWTRWSRAPRPPPAGVRGPP